MKFNSGVKNYLLAAIFGLLMQTWAFAATNKIDWQPYNKVIFTNSIKEHKPILLFVKADWCPHCKTMRETTLQDSSVVKLVNESFIPVMIDADKDRELVKSYKVTGLPAFIILNSENKPVKDFAGEVSIIDFMQNLSQGYKEFANKKG